MPKNTVKGIMAERNTSTVSATGIVKCWQNPDLVEHIVNAKPLENLLLLSFPWHDLLQEKDPKQEESTSVTAADDQVLKSSKSFSPAGWKSIGPKSVFPTQLVESSGGDSLRASSPAGSNADHVHVFEEEELNELPQTSVGKIFWLKIDPHQIPQIQPMIYWSTAFCIGKDMIMTASYLWNEYFDAAIFIPAMINKYDVYGKNYGYYGVEVRGKELLVSGHIDCTLHKIIYGKRMSKNFYKTYPCTDNGSIKLRKLSKDNLEKHSDRSKKHEALKGIQISCFSEDITRWAVYGYGAFNKDGKMMKTEGKQRDISKLVSRYREYVDLSQMSLIAIEARVHLGIGGPWIPLSNPLVSNGCQVLVDAENGVCLSPRFTDDLQHRVQRELESKYNLVKHEQSDSESGVSTEDGHNVSQHIEHEQSDPQSTKHNLKADSKVMPKAEDTWPTADLILRCWEAPDMQDHILDAEPLEYLVQSLIGKDLAVREDRFQKTLHLTESQSPEEEKDSSGGGNSEFKHKACSDQADYFTIETGGGESDVSPIRAKTPDKVFQEEELANYPQKSVGRLFWLKVDSTTGNPIISVPVSWSTAFYIGNETIVTACHVFYYIKKNSEGIQTLLKKNINAAIFVPAMINKYDIYGKNYGHYAIEIPHEHPLFKKGDETPEYDVATVKLKSGKRMKPNIYLRLPCTPDGFRDLKVLTLPKRERLFIHIDRIPLPLTVCFYDDVECDEWTVYGYGVCNCAGSNNERNCRCHCNDDGKLVSYTGKWTPLNCTETNIVGIDVAVQQGMSGGPWIPSTFSNSVAVGCQCIVRRCNENGKLTSHSPKFTQELLTEIGVLNSGLSRSISEPGTTATQSIEHNLMRSSSAS